jgi:hypothetical protein
LAFIVDVTRDRFESAFISPFPDDAKDGYRRSNDNDVNVGDSGCDKPRNDKDNNADINNEFGAVDNDVIG